MSFNNASGGLIYSARVKQSPLLLDLKVPQYACRPSPHLSPVGFVHNLVFAKP
jgi:hypothetical protein